MKLRCYYCLLESLTEDKNEEGTILGGLAVCGSHFEKHAQTMQQKLANVKKRSVW